MNQNSGNSIATNQSNVGAGVGGHKDGTSNANAEPATKASHASNNAPPSDSKTDAKASIDASNAHLGNANETKDCVGCGVPCNRTNKSPHGALCNSCYHHWRYSSTNKYKRKRKSFDPFITHCSTSHLCLKIAAPRQKQKCFSNTPNQMARIQSKSKLFSLLRARARIEYARIKIPIMCNG